MTQLHQWKEEAKTTKQQLGSLKSYAQVSFFKYLQKGGCEKERKRSEQTPRPTS
jgi:hypothetical protein